MERNIQGWQYSLLQDSFNQIMFLEFNAFDYSYAPASAFLKSLSEVPNGHLKACDTIF